MSKTNINELEVNKVVYVPKSSSSVTNKDGLVYSMVRTYSAGVFAGYIKNRNGKEAELLEARRIWYWEGAASLSELATRGTSQPSKCKFPMAVASVILTDVIEIIPITETAKKSIEEVPIWTK